MILIAPDGRELEIDLTLEQLSTLFLLHGMTVRCRGQVQYTVPPWLDALSDVVLSRYPPM